MQGRGRRGWSPTDLKVARFSLLAGTGRVGRGFDTKMDEFVESSFPNGLRLSVLGPRKLPNFWKLVEARWKRGRTKLSWTLLAPRSSGVTSTSEVELRSVPKMPWVAWGFPEESWAAGLAIGETTSLMSPGAKSSKIMWSEIFGNTCPKLKGTAKLFSSPWAAGGPGSSSFGAE